MAYRKRFIWTIRMAMAWNCIGTGLGNNGLYCPMARCKCLPVHWIQKICSASWNKARKAEIKVFSEFWYMQAEIHKLDILAIAAHPDDVELSCAGTLMV